MIRFFFLMAMAVFLLVACGGHEQAGQVDTQPNVLLIVIDDIGHADLGVFGAEISTPNIDRLARGGVLLTSFYVAPTCSPTRAMLLSGVDHHRAGLGHMAEDLAPNQLGQPGYEGHLNFAVAALPELLRDAGYWTAMAGKWHLGLDAETSPAARGFERSYAQLQGGAGHFDNLNLVGPGSALFREDGERVDYPAGEYSSRFYTSRLIEYLQDNRRRDKPFFGYLAFTAPHWPLQAPRETVERYGGRYDAGYDMLANARLSKQQELGFVPDDLLYTAQFPGHRPWSALSDTERQIEARKMEVYAAMVEEVDTAIGRMLAYLEETNQLANTFIFVMSDNGPEAHDMDVAFPEAAEWSRECCDNSFENIGNADSYVWQGLGWGRASGVPYRMYKGYPSEGGIRVPAIASAPALIRQGERSDAIATVRDVVPTILEITGVDHPGTRYAGRDVHPADGVSLLSYLQGERSEAHADDEPFGWELYGKRAIRKGDWKIVWEPAPAGVVATL
jgi:arylsulfatase